MLSKINQRQTNNAQSWLFMEPLISGLIEAKNRIVAANCRMGDFSQSNIVQLNIANLIPITVTIANNIVLNN